VFDWVPEACERLEGSPSLAAFSAWLGGEPNHDTVRASHPAALAADEVLVLGTEGTASSLTAFYGRDTGPTAAEAARTLGPARELPRPALGPFQLAFPPRGTCFVAATTLDPPTLPPTERRLVELILRRD
jgi:hypothetical protein